MENTSFHSPQSPIHVIVRALITREDKIILCNVKGKDWHFLPGGHVEIGEGVIETLERELNEETGGFVYSNPEFIGICENIFDYDEKSKQHEINIVFKIKVDKNTEINSKEGHIEFHEYPEDNIEHLKVLPAQIKDGIIKWRETGVPFFNRIPTINSGIDK